ncbi:MAG: hypothetical protein R6X02_27075 [Enhygromyxa sp.]
MRFKTPLAASAAWWLAACSPEPQPQPQSEPAKVVERASTDESDQAEQPNDEAAEPDDEAVIEIEGPQSRRERGMVPIRPVSPTPATVTWREVQTLPETKLELVPVASGVVARSPSGVYELGKDRQLTLRPELTLPDAPLLGHWPGDVWYAEATPVEDDAEGRPSFEFKLFRLDRERRWVAHTHKRQPSFRGQALRKGWRAGVLVRDGGSLTRLGHRKAAPKIGMRMGKLVLDTIETASGRLYNVSQRPNGVYVQEACFTQRCVEDHAKRLPSGNEWSFGAQIPRQRNSFSMVATLELDGAVSHQLLHYETGGWSLEPLLREPSGLWPTADGGLWMLIAGELRYRTAKGQWYAITLPKGASRISAAMRPDLRELWIAARVGEQTVVYATDAIVQDLPAPG